MEPAFGGMAIASASHAIEEYIYPGGFLGWMRGVFPHSAPGVGTAIAINGAFLRLCCRRSFQRHKPLPFSVCRLQVCFLPMALFTWGAHGWRAATHPAPLHLSCVISQPRFIPWS